jgi:hypothetical protein
MKKNWFLLLLLPLWACDLDKRIISKEKKAEPAQVVNVQKEDFYETQKKAIRRVVAYSPEAWDFLGSFLSDKKTDNIQFVESILKDTATFAEGPHWGDSYKTTKYGLPKPYSIGNYWAKGNKTPFEYYKDSIFIPLGGYPFKIWYANAKFLDHKIKANVIGYLTYFIDRKPTTIDSIYQQYKAIILERLHPNSYHRMVGKMPKKLMERYQYWKENNYQKVFYEYTILLHKLETEPAFAEEWYQKRFESPDRHMILKNSKEGDIMSYYPDNFWYIRYKEGNMDIVYKILREVDQYYDQFPRPKDAQ